LFQKYLFEDDVVDVAVDAYANDRDVVKFLETLQDLAGKAEAGFAKQEAMETIVKAKRELLHHSLTMMVKEGHISQAGSVSIRFILILLFTRFHLH
jgi:hypothetical protein